MIIINKEYIVLCGYRFKITACDTNQLSHTKSICSMSVHYNHALNKFILPVLLILYLLLMY